MIDLHEARQIAEKHLHRNDIDEDIGRFVMLSERTISKPYGWVFFYQGSKYLETKRRAYALMGNAPLVVLRMTGVVIVTGTAGPIDWYLGGIEKTLPPTWLNGPSDGVI